MKTYIEYEELAKEEIKRIYGVGTVGHIQHLDRDLAIMTQSMILLDLLNSNKSVEVEEVTTEVVEKKPTRGGK